MKNKKGFTMIELLLVIMLIGLLSIASYSAYNGSVATFRFLSNYKSAMSLVRNARSYAIVNKDSENIERYGVRIETTGEAANKITRVILFEDKGNPFEYFSGIDTVIDEVDYVMPFTIANVTGTNAPMPVTFYYDVGSGELTVNSGASSGANSQGETTSLISKTEHPYITFKLTDGKIERYIVVFQVSGLAEEFTQMP